MTLTILAAGNTFVPPGGVAVGQTAPVGCDSWNSQEFFEAATVADVARCLQQGVDVRARDDDDSSLLLYAALYGSSAVVGFLLSAGAMPDLHVENDQGIRPLHMAVASGSADVFRAIWDAGGNADVRAKTDEGWSPLLYASRYAGSEVVEFLLSAGALPDLNSDNDWGSKPLHFATASADVFRVIWDAGGSADVRARDYRGWTPLYQAARYGNSEVVEFLLSNGADGGSRIMDGVSPVSPLHLAVRYGTARMVEALLNAGAVANINTPTDTTLHYHLNTPLGIAYASGSWELVELLLDYGARRVGRQGESICGETPDTQLLMIWPPSTETPGWRANSRGLSQTWESEAAALEWEYDVLDRPLLEERLGLTYSYDSKELFWLTVKERLTSCSARVLNGEAVRIYVLPFTMLEHPALRENEFGSAVFPLDNVRPWLWVFPGPPFQERTPSG